MADDQLVELRKRQLTKQTLHVGSKVWAAYGETKWSPIDVIEIGRVWGRGRVVNPKTGSAKKGSRKFHLGRCLKRDPTLLGQDKPDLFPSDVFAHVKEQEEQERERKRQAEQATAIAREKKRPRTPAEEAEAMKRLQRLIDRFDDGSTTDDW